MQKEKGWQNSSGLSAEARAAEYFLALHQGRARLVAERFRIPQGEIDLVFEVERELVFVEVRSRGPGSWVGGIESVTHAKQRRLRKAVEVYLARYRGVAESCRVDVMDWDGTRWVHARDVRLAG